MNKRDWLPAAACFAGILLLSSIPPSGIPRVGFPGLDKLVHLAIYTALGLCLSRLRWRFHQAWLLGAALAATDEAYQHLISNRQAELADWIADGLGLALGLTLAAWLRARSSPPPHPPQSP